jgi:hypothetical protein
LVCVVGKSVDMKRLKIIFYILAILIVIISKTAFGQTRPENTASARAYYGSKPGKPNFKATRTKKIKNYTHTKPAKGTQVSQKTTRRKYARTWAS